MTFPQFVYRNVSRNKRTYLAYFLSSAFSVMIFFVYALFIFHPGIEEGVTAVLAVKLMIASEWIMYVFSFLFVLYSVSTFLKTRQKEFGVLMLLGMTRSQLNRLVFLENMLIGIGAIAAGLGVGLITGKLFFMIGSKMIGIETLPFILSGKALILTIAAFFILFLCISFFTSIFVQVNNLIDLFHAGEKPKPEPKVSVLLSLFAAVLLSASYYFAITATVQNLLYRMLPVIGMTIVGTYFLYTQLSVFITKLLKKNRSFYMRKTNLITLSSLAYRLKDNARMFFMVTIVSTVAFCAIGTLASLNTLNDEMDLSLPAEVGYIAKDDQSIHEENIKKLQEEFEDRGLEYTTNQVEIKFVEVKSSSDDFTPKHLAVVSFSDYQQIAEAANFKFTEEPLVVNEALEIKKTTYSNWKTISYTLMQSDIEINYNRMTEHVVFPIQLLDSTGVVVSDELYSTLEPSYTQTYYGFYTKKLTDTKGIGEGTLVQDGATVPAEQASYTMAVSGTLQQLQMSLINVMLFVALLIGAVFFVAADSFLYFRLYADFDYDRRLYETISKVGLTDRELKHIVTIQLALLFFVPIAVAFVHSGFAFSALQSFYTLPITKYMIIVLAAFLIYQLLYFLFARHYYLRKLMKSLI